MKKILIVVIVLLGRIGHAQTNITNNIGDFELIKKNLIKTVSLGGILINISNIDNNSHLVGDSYKSPRRLSYTFQFPGFGYMPGEVDFALTPLGLEYPDSSLRLYNVSFADTPENDTLISWTRNGLSFLSFKKNMLLGVNQDGDVIYMSSGTLLEHHIAKDFHLDPDVPESYLPFLKFKLYRFQFDTVFYARKDDEKLVFIGATDMEGGKVSKCEFYIDPEYPDRVKGKYIGDRFTGSYPPRPKIKFKGFNDKKNYLFDGLMKNLYMYRVHQINDIEKTLGIDTADFHFTDKSSKIDDILPDYNEYLSRMRVISISLRGNLQYCKDAWPSYQNFITDGATGIVGNSPSKNIEFYRIFKDKEDFLCKQVVSGSGGQITTCRYDLFYSPEQKERHRQSMEEHGYPPPPPEPIPEYLFEENPKCSPYGTTFSQKWKKRFDYYLLALDVETREIFFISGKDIYLTKSVHLYPPEEKELPENIREWGLAYKLDYIKDRLYCYQVASVKEDNIVFIDDQKLVLNVKGEEYGTGQTYKVTFYNNRPEILEIEIF